MGIEKRKCGQFDGCTVDRIVLIATIILGLAIIAWMPSARNSFKVDYIIRPYMIIQTILIPAALFGLGYVLTWCVGRLFKLSFALSKTLQIIFAIFIIVMTLGYAAVCAGYYLWGLSLSHALVVNIVMNRGILMIPAILLCLPGHCKSSPSN